MMRKMIYSTKKCDYLLNMLRNEMFESSLKKRRDLDILVPCVTCERQLLCTEWGTHRHVSLYFITFITG